MKDLVLPLVILRYRRVRGAHMKHTRWSGASGHVPKPAHCFSVWGMNKAFVGNELGGEGSDGSTTPKSSPICAPLSVES